MPATLDQLLALRSQAADSICHYLRSMIDDLGQNRLLTRLGYSLDPSGRNLGLRLPLYCEPFSIEIDSESVRMREKLYTFHGDDDGGGSSTGQRFASSRHRSTSPSRNEESSDMHDDAAEKSDARSLDELAEELEMLLIIGDPGSGKTEWLKHRAVVAARRELEKLCAGQVLAEDTRMPVFVRLPDLGRILEDEGKVPPEELEKFALEECGSLACEVTVGDPAARAMSGILWLLAKGGRRSLSGFSLRHLWRQWCNAALHLSQGNPSLLCLDAWDEVPDACRGAVLKCINELTDELPLKVFASSRAVGYQPGLLPVPFGKSNQERSPRREVHLLDFGWSQVTEFYLRMFGSDSEEANEFLSTLKKKPQIQALACNPLMATLIGGVFGPRVSSRTPLNLVARRTDVFREVLRDMMSRPGIEKLVVDLKTTPAKLDFLAAFAFRFFPDELIPLRAAEEFTAAYLESISHTSSNLRMHQEVVARGKRDVLENLSAVDDVLVLCEEQDGPAYMFLHLTLQEHLAARHVAGLVNDTGWDNATLQVGRFQQKVRVPDFIDRRCEAPRWHEFFCQLSGQLTDAEPLLDLLQSGSALTAPSVQRFRDFFEYRCRLAASACAETLPAARRDCVGGATSTIARWITFHCETSQDDAALFHKAFADLATINPNMHFELPNGDSRARSFVEVLLNSLRNAGASERKKILMAIEACGPALAHDAFLRGIARVIADPASEGKVYDLTQAISKMGVSAAQPEFIADLVDILSQQRTPSKDGSSSIQIAVINLLASFGPAACKPDVLNELQCIIKEGAWRDEPVWNALVDICAANGMSLILPFLRDYFASAKVQEISFKSLNKLGKHCADDQLIRSVINHLSHEHEQIREVAADALGSMTHLPWLRAKLRELLFGEDRSLAAWAARALGHSNPNTISREEIRQLLDLVAEPDWPESWYLREGPGTRLGHQRIREIAVHACRQLVKNNASMTWVEELLPLLRADRTMVCYRAMDIVRELRVDSLSPHLYDVFLPLMQSRDMCTRRNACDDVGRFGVDLDDERVVRSLLNCLDDHESQVVYAAAHALSHCRGDRYAGQIVSDLEHRAESSYRDTKLLVATALAGLLPRAADSRPCDLLVRLIKDPDNSVCARALETLIDWRIKWPSSPLPGFVPSVVVEQVIRPCHPTVEAGLNYQTVARTLRVIGRMAQRSQLMSRVLDASKASDATVRLAACECLGVFGREWDLPGRMDSLTALLNDEDKWVRRKAVEILPDVIVWDRSPESLRKAFLDRFDDSSGYVRNYLPAAITGFVLSDYGSGSHNFISRFGDYICDQLKCDDGALNSDLWYCLKTLRNYLRFFAVEDGETLHYEWRMVSAMSALKTESVES
jgi:HEAT repeat protein